MYKVKLYRNKKVVGKCNIEILDEISWITGVLIYKKFRGMGYSKFLIKKAINLIKRTKIKTVMLHVKHDNIPAIKTYKNNGFLIIRKNYDNNGKLFGYTMRLEL